jgi:superfamily II DNA or RNA helicase
VILRPYQAEAVARSRDVLRAGRRCILIVAPTGAGKTVIAAHVIASAVARGRRVLFVAHRRELIDQAFGKLRDAGLREVGVIMAGDRRRNPPAPVQVASIDTLRRRAKPAADLVIIDEAHRALARSYAELREAYPLATHLGLTATPYRADGRGLGDAYQALIVVASPATLIADGYLVEPRVYTVPAAELPDLSRVRLKGGDYHPEQLSAAVDRSGLVGSIVEHWQRHAGGQRTVAFAASVAHSQHIARSFVAAGIPAEHLDGETPTDERAAILRRLETGETRVVANYGVLCEGWDQPSVKIAVLARPTKSPGLYLQQAGRILRPWQAVGAVILDHAGVVLEHGLPHDDREFSLDGDKRERAKRTAPSCKTCERCFAIVRSSVAVCPCCGWAWPDAPERDIEEQPGDLVEVRAVTQDEKRATWAELVRTAGERGYAPGWAAYRYRDKFGAWPPTTFPRPARCAVDASDEAKLEYLGELRRVAAERGYQHGWIALRFRARYGGRDDAT